MEARSSSTPRPTRHSPRTTCSPSSATTRRPTTGACSRPARSCASTATTASGSRSSTSCTTRRRATRRCCTRPRTPSASPTPTRCARPGTQASCSRSRTTPTALGFAIDPSMGELAPQLGQPQDALPRPARGGARAARLHGTAACRRSQARAQPLFVTSTLRDDEYQELLRGRNPEATARLLAAHDRLRVRRPPQVRVGPPGAGVPVPARRPHRARPHRVDPRAGRDPRHGVAGGRGARACSSSSRSRGQGKRDRPGSRSRRAAVPALGRHAILEARRPREARSPPAAAASAARAVLRRARAAGRARRPTAAA